MSQRFNWTHLWERVDELAGDMDRHAAVLAVSNELNLEAARHFAYQGLLDGYRVFKASQRAAATNGEVEPTDPTAERKQMIDEEFPIPGTKPTEWVRWADATIEHHAAREMRLRKLVSGALREADRHADAISRIKTAGVTCLREIDAEQPIPESTSESASAARRRPKMTVVA